MDSPYRVNILLRTLPGLSLPPTVSLPLPSAATTSELLDRITDILPSSLSSRLILTTTSNRAILPSSSPISSLLPPPSTTTPSQTHYAVPFLPLHLSAPVPGGKGGFGSQLRAAGGRMSSRKRKNALASDPNAGVGSNRNLDGRRLRTITEAKNLAEYLATKPEMERREKEERRRRWEGVVDAAERREQEIRKGLGGQGRRKGLSEEWLVEREDAGERTRDAVRRAMMDGGGWKDSVAGKGSGESSAGASARGSGASREPSEENSDQDDDMDLDEEEVKLLEKEAADGDVDAIWVLKNHVKKPPPKKKEEERRFVDFDEDVEFMSSSEDEDAPTSKSKGKETVSAET